MRLPPWHMWGTSVAVPVRTPGGGLAGSASSAQLARINYRRPETWSFLLTARILDLRDTSGAPDPADTLLVQVTFFVQIGVGRSVFITPQPNLAAGFFSVPQTPFGQFIWRAIPQNVAPENIPYNPRWVTETFGSPQDDSQEIDTRSACRWFPAQDIQAGAIIGINAQDPWEATVEVGAYFAPRTHVRPDWYDDKQVPAGRFTGDEKRGT